MHKQHASLVSRCCVAVYDFYAAARSLATKNDKAWSLYSHYIVMNYIWYILYTH